MNEQEVLRQPFDFKTHKKTFVDYLEVIINDTGVIMYATPSHQEKLIAIICEQQNITRAELNAKCPREYYFDFMTWLCQESNCLAVWNARIEGIPNEVQTKKLKQLTNEGLYHGPLTNEVRQKHYF